MSLNRHNEKKTWLLTGWDIRTDPKEEKQEYLKKKGLVSDEQGKFCARHLPTQTEPTFSRLCLGADKDLEEIINQLKKKSRNKSMAQDMNTIKKEIREEMRATELAVREVMPLAGEFDSMAFDSAGQVYLKACRFLGVQATAQSARDVYRAVFAATSLGHPENMPSRKMWRVPAGLSRKICISTKRTAYRIFIRIFQIQGR